jgi:S1-C subfamily serine protease
MKVGDVVIECEGKPIDSAKNLTAAIRSNPALANISLKVLRDGQEVVLSVTLGDADSSN